MSVVNEVLRDLSKRQPDAYAHLSPEPAIDSGGNRLTIVLPVIMALLLAVGAWWFFMKDSRTTDSNAPRVTIVEAVAATQNTSAPSPSDIETANSAVNENTAPQTSSDSIQLLDNTRASTVLVSRSGVEQVSTRESARNLPPVAAHVSAPAASAISKPNTNEFAAPKTVAVHGSVHLDSESTNNTGTRKNSTAATQSSSAIPAQDAQESATTVVDIRPHQKSIAEQQRTLFRSAQSAIARGDLINAERWLEEAVLLNPQNDSIRHAWLKTLSATNEAKAELELNKQITAFPAEWSMRELLGALLVRQQRFDEALKTLASTPPPITSAINYHAVMALAYQQSGQHQQALQLYRALIQLQPTHGAHYAGAALSAEQLGDSRYASYAYGKALEDYSLATPLREYAEQRRRQILQASP